MIAFCLVIVILAALPAVLFVRNFRLYVPPEKVRTVPMPRISVLIPARNEAHNIQDAINCALRNERVELEIIVADDTSDDDTGEIVRALAAADARIRLITTPPLPAGWNGKQHACYHLAQAATMPLLCFVDADVRLEPNALAAMAGFLETSRASLASGVPRQITRSWMESLLIPLIHFVLLGFLPIDRMRRSVDPAYAAGCGQIFMAVKRDYHTVGGHAAIRTTLHDGIRLPAVFRAAGFRTDLFDATTIASCRMYHNAAEVWSGLAKNATEGMAAPARLPIFTALLLGGQVLPSVVLCWAAVAHKPLIAALAGVAVTLSYLPRLIAWRRFRQPLWSCALHPLGISLLLLIQWFALGTSLLGKPTSWKGRSYELRST